MACRERGGMPVRRWRGEDPRVRLQVQAAARGGSWPRRGRERIAQHAVLGLGAPVLLPSRPEGTGGTVPAASSFPCTRDSLPGKDAGFRARFIASPRDARVVLALLDPSTSCWAILSLPLMGQGVLDRASPHLVRSDAARKDFPSPQYPQRLGEARKTRENPGRHSSCLLKAAPTRRPRMRRDVTHDKGGSPRGGSSARSALCPLHAPASHGSTRVPLPYHAESSIGVSTWKHSTIRTPRSLTGVPVLSERYFKVSWTASVWLSARHWSTPTSPLFTQKNTTWYHFIILSSYPAAD